MVFLMHSEQGPPCISALSHFTRRNRHESHALRDGRIALVQHTPAICPSSEGQSRATSRAKRTGNAATHTSCFRFFFGLPFLSSLTAPLADRFPPAAFLRDGVPSLVPTSPSPLSACSRRFRFGSAPSSPGNGSCEVDARALSPEGLLPWTAAIASALAECSR